MLTLTIPARPTDHNFVDLLREQAPACPITGPLFVELELVQTWPPHIQARGRGKACRASTVDCLIHALFPKLDGLLWEHDGQVVDFTARVTRGREKVTTVKVRKLGSEYAKYMAQREDL